MPESWALGKHVGILFVSGPVGGHSGVHQRGLNAGKAARNP